MIQNYSFYKKDLALMSYCLKIGLKVSPTYKPGIGLCLIITYKDETIEDNYSFKDNELGYKVILAYRKYYKRLHDNKSIFEVKEVEVIKEDIDSEKNINPLWGTQSKLI